MSLPSLLLKSKPSKKQASSRWEVMASNGLHGVISEKTEPFITTAVRTSNPKISNTSSSYLYIQHICKVREQLPVRPTAVLRILLRSLLQKKRNIFFVVAVF
jgi:hypothetical protein